MCKWFQRTSLYAVGSKVADDGYGVKDPNLEKDDFVSPITIETYMEYRGKPLTLGWEKSTPQVNKLLSNLEILAFAFTSAGAVLAVPGVDVGQYVAITVALGTGVNTYIDYYQLRTERSATRRTAVSQSSRTCSCGGSRCRSSRSARRRPRRRRLGRSSAVCSCCTRGWHHIEKRL